METAKPQPPSRRDFLDAACALSGGAACAFAAVPAVTYLIPRPSFLPTGPIEVGPDDLLEGGGKAVKVGPLSLLVVKSGGKLTAVNAKCTHLACLVKWDDKSNLIRCPCHSATFQPDGTKPTTPATKDLAPFPVRSENGKIIVTF